jgi:type VI secretion system secreted protein Hcp
MMPASAANALHPAILFSRVHDEALLHKGALQMADVDYFLKLDGIDGETKQKGHEKEIEVASWHFGATNHGTFAASSGGGAGKVSMQDFHFAMYINKASPKLLQACATGQHIKSAKLTCRKAGETQQEYYKVNFTDLLVSSYQINGGSHGTDLPMEQISLNFAKIEIEYAEQGADGKLGAAIKAGYDLKVGAKV